MKINNFWYHSTLHLLEALLYHLDMEHNSHTIALWTNRLLPHSTQTKVLLKPDKTQGQDWPHLLAKADAGMGGRGPRVARA